LIDPLGNGDVLDGHAYGIEVNDFVIPFAARLFISYQFTKFCIDGRIVDFPLFDTQKRSRSWNSMAGQIPIGSMFPV
jgi:hypothetical protein